MFLSKCLINKTKKMHKHVIFPNFVTLKPFLATTTSSCRHHHHHHILPPPLRPHPPPLTLCRSATQLFLEDKVAKTVSRFNLLIRRIFRNIQNFIRVSSICNHRG
ncbi:hypothetical protein HanIR_Chr09g0432031 [Helianthus annuus]|nr:hypothetical protein HanIR_Chr09g0432031 [Helianthus annuus]